jgi:peptidoglycan/xylan/chitin deacetylase (PgdA/CDA1 family)
MWPEDVQCAAALTFDLDIETPWMVKDPGFARRPGALSMAHYAPRVAIPLILSLLEDLELKATFFVPGKSAEDFAASVESIVAAGHEIAVHGYTHVPPSSLTRVEEEAQLKRTTDILRGLGVEVVGYRAPLYEISVHTLALLRQYGIRYSSNLMDDFKPYRHPDTGLIELPVSWILDDWTQFGHGADEWLERNVTCAQVKQLWLEEFQGIYAHGGLFVLTMHPQVIGRPARMRMLADLVSEMRALEGVWVATCAEISAHVADTLR